MERPKKQEKGPPDDPRWDRKQGTAKDRRMARDVEKSSGRYSGSEQSEEKGTATSTTMELTMLVKEAMSRDVKMVGPDAPIQEAARIMLDMDVGALPVSENDRLVGMITDRDIAVRGVAAGKTASVRVHEVMSGEIKYCFEDEDMAHVARNMGDQQIRRLPVVDRNKRLVGIIALADLVTSAKAGHATAALSGISQAGGPHSQST
jgi:CBS domain-containing protein